MALSRLYFITMDNGPVGPLEQIAQACKAGVRLIQLRMKEVGDEEFLATAREAMKICSGWNSRLIINDRVGIAVAVGADGVHVGKEDLSVGEARALLGAGKIVGGTANTLEDIRAHHSGGADYIGLGPYRYTATKKKLSPILGLEGYRRVMGDMAEEGIDLPVYAIGGIGVADVRPLVDAGAYGVAFSGLLLYAEDRVAAVREMEAAAGDVENIKTM
jgi:thiamine-phosphate pyrophosphorylase